MNPTEASELLERAAASVTPAETDPATRMVSLGRRSVKRRRVWAVAGAVAAVVAVPLAVALPGQLKPAPPATTVQFGGLTVAVPKGWRTSTVTAFEPCTAEPRTLYLAERYELKFRGGQPSEGPAGEPPSCRSGDQEWIALIQNDDGLTISPELLVPKDGQPIQVDQPDEIGLPSLWAYRAIVEIKAPAAFISGDSKAQQRLLERVTWPAGPPAPPSGGLELPDRVTSVTTDLPPLNHMTDAQDAKTLRTIRAKLAELREPVPAGEECALRRPGSVGISLGGGALVVLGDETCPQAISNGGGRVRVPAGLGQELMDLIEASDRAASGLPPRK